MYRIVSWEFLRYWNRSNRWLKESILCCIVRKAVIYTLVENQAKWKGFVCLFLYHPFMSSCKNVRRTNGGKKHRILSHCTLLVWLICLIFDWRWLIFSCSDTFNDNYTNIALLSLRQCYSCEKISEKLIMCVNTDYRKKWVLQCLSSTRCVWWLDVSSPVNVPYHEAKMVII